MGMPIADGHTIVVRQNAWRRTISQAAITGLRKPRNPRNLHDFPSGPQTQFDQIIFNIPRQERTLLSVIVGKSRD